MATQRDAGARARRAAASPGAVRVVTGKKSTPKLAQAARRKIRIDAGIVDGSSDDDLEGDARMGEADSEALALGFTEAPLPTHWQRVGPREPAPRGGCGAPRRDGRSAHAGRGRCTRSC